MSDHKGGCPHILIGPVSGVRLPTFGAKQVSIAGDVAVRHAIMLRMTPSSQGLPATLAPQAGSVPISAQRHHFLSKKDRIPTSRAQ